MWCRAPDKMEAHTKHIHGKTWLYSGYCLKRLTGAVLHLCSCCCCCISGTQVVQQKAAKLCCRYISVTCDESHGAAAENCNRSISTKNNEHGNFPREKNTLLHLYVNIYRQNMYIKHLSCRSQNIKSQVPLSIEN